MNKRKSDAKQIEKLTKLLAESQRIAKLGGWELDVVSGELVWTEETYRLHDTSPEEFNPTVDAGVSYFLPESQEIILAALDEAITNGKNYDLELQTFTTKGRQIDVRTTCQVTQQNGKTIKLTGIFQDITERKQVENKLKESEERLALAMQGTQEGLWDWNLLTDTVYLSPRWKSMLGYEDSEIKNEFSEWKRLLHPDELESALSKVEYFINNKTDKYESEFRMQHKDGHYLNILSRAFAVEGSDGKVTRFVGTHVDITNKKQEETVLRLNKSAVEASTAAIVIVDAIQADMPIVFVNPAFEKMTGYIQSEVLGKNCRFLNTGVRDEEKLNMLRTALANGQDYETELLNKKKDGSFYWNALKISPLIDEVGKISHFVGVQMDITERRTAEAEYNAINKKNQYLAYYDSLTQIPNRASLNKYLEELVFLSSKEETVHAIFFMDLDNFKNVNDTFGHTMGDKLLKAFAIRLSSFLDGRCFISRFGGDEFVLVMSDKKENADMFFEKARSKANTILSMMLEPFRLDGLEFHSSISIGLKFVHSELNVDNALKRVDLALNEAKRLGKNNVQLFDNKLEQAALKKSKLEEVLRKAIQKEEFELHYQPQINSDNKIFGCEALIRWHSSEMGCNVSPAEFIPIAEQTSLILIIGEWVLETACKTLDKWHQLEVFKDIEISINISAIQFKNSNFIKLLEDTLISYTFNRSNLKLELTETMLVESFEDTIKVMNQIRAMGLTISLDDFGTGYSSLSYLKAFPINQLKIDQSFVRDILIDNNDLLIADAIIKLSVTLGLDTIAEGVETEEQKECLIKLGCNQFQGYLFSKALALGDIENFIHQFDIKEKQILE